MQLYTINDYDNYWSLHAAKSASHLRTSKYKITQRSMCERTRRNYRVSSSRLRVTYFHTFFIFLYFFHFFLFFRADRAKKHRRDGHRCFLPFRFVIARCACVTLILKYIYSVWCACVREFFSNPFSTFFFFILLLYKKRITLVIIGIYSIASRFNEFTKIPGTVQVWSTYTSRCRNTVKQAVTRIAGNNDRKIEYACIAAPFFLDRALVPGAS